jgi:hypothetical protein
MGGRRGEKRDKNHYILKISSSNRSDAFKTDLLTKTKSRAAIVPRGEK